MAGKYRAGARYRVTGAYVTCKTDTPQGKMIVSLHTGAPVPVDAEPDWIQHHLNVGLIEEVPDPRAKVREAEAAEKAAAKAKADAEAAKIQAEADAKAAGQNTKGA